MVTLDKDPSVDATSAAKAILEERACGKRGCPCEAAVRNGHGNTHCPAHVDEHPSLSVSAGKAGKPLVKCHAGCEQEAVIRELRERDLWPTAAPGTNGTSEGGLTLDVLAREKGLDPAFVRSLGVTDSCTGNPRVPCVGIPYVDENGEVVAVRTRLNLTGGGRFRWRRGDHPVPYRLDWLAAIRRGGSLLLVEGESDAWTCLQAKVPVLGVPGANTWQHEWVAKYRLDELNIVAVWREPDGGGDALANKVVASLPNVRVIDAPPGIKDPSALWLSLGCDATAFQERIRELVRSARPASALRQETTSREACEAFERSRALLDAPDIVSKEPPRRIAASQSGRESASPTTTVRCS